MGKGRIAASALAFACAAGLLAGCHPTEGETAMKKVPETVESETNSTFFSTVHIEDKKPYPSP